MKENKEKNKGWQARIIKNNPFSKLLTLRYCN